MSKRHMLSPVLATALLWSSPAVRATEVHGFEITVEAKSDGLLHSIKVPSHSQPPSSAAVAKIVVEFSAPARVVSSPKGWNHNVERLPDHQISTVTWARTFRAGDKGRGKAAQIGGFSAFTDKPATCDSWWAYTIEFADGTYEHGGNYCVE